VKAAGGKPKPPVYILAPHGSKGSLLAAALGRHPGLFAAPHLNLLAFDTVRQLVRFAKVPREVHSHGLVRMLSSMIVGEQSIDAAQAARRWLGRHDAKTTREVYGLIAEWLHPRRLVEYSPLYAYHRQVVERVVAAAPQATFIHLVRHPTTTAMEIARAAMQTIDAALGRYTQEDHYQPTLDILELADTAIDWQNDPVFDPQFLWYRAHHAITEVLESVPRARVIELRTEDLLADPEAALAGLCRRLRLPAEPDTLRRMLRTEEDGFAGPGPFGASRGVDWDFLADPGFPEPDPPATLAGELPWRRDGNGYQPEVIELAGRFGYGHGPGAAPLPVRAQHLSSMTASTTRQ
jgi:hypothetical protein